jgi:hypothetical protein
VIERQILFAMIDAVAEVGIIQVQLADDIFGVWLNQQLFGVEAMATLRVFWTVHPVSIE